MYAIILNSAGQLSSLKYEQQGELSCQSTWQEAVLTLFTFGRTYIPECKTPSIQAALTKDSGLRRNFRVSGKIKM